MSLRGKAEAIPAELQYTTGSPRAETCRVSALAMTYTTCYEVSFLGKLRCNVLRKLRSYLIRGKCKSIAFGVAVAMIKAILRLYRPLIDGADRRAFNRFGRLVERSVRGG